MSFRDAVLAVVVLESKGVAGHANSSDNALASYKSAVSNPEDAHPYSSYRLGATVIFHQEM